MSSELIGRTNSNKTLRQDEFWALKDVSFQLNRGQILGIIGPNGAGKTTLLRMLNGLIKPDAGRIQIKGRMQALIALGAGFNPILTGRDNIYVNASVLGIPKREIDCKFDEIVDFSGIGAFIDTPVQTYSSGMAVRLGFAVAAHMDPDIMLVDEVLAVGDEGFQNKCLNRIGALKKNGTAIILVSHNMHTISTFSSKVILLNSGSYRNFVNVPEGVQEYRSLFNNNEDGQIQRVCSGNENINFYEVDINKKTFYPGDSFNIQIKYESIIDYDEIEIDTVIYCNNQPGIYFQATNEAYDRVISLKRGNHEIKISINDIPINNANGIIAVTFWSKNHDSELFWWRIPVTFMGHDHSVGSNFLNIDYSQ